MNSKSLVNLGRRSISSSCCNWGKPVTITHEFHNIIKHVRPDRLKSWDPQRSCDLRPLIKIDPNWLKFEYRPFADLIKQLPEDHQKAFTVGFGHRKDAIKVIMEDTLSKTRRHKYDNESLDFKISWATVRIRDYQDAFAKFNAMRRAGFHRNNVKELIEKRKKWLRWMRIADYKRFEWILEVLGVLYKSPVPHTRIERKASLDVIVNMFCNEIRDKKMAEYKQMLEAEKIPFLENKLETLHSIKADEESINMPCSVLDDIDQTKEMLEKLKKSHMTVYPVESGLLELNAPK